MKIKERFSHLQSNSYKFQISSSSLKISSFSNELRLVVGKETSAKLKLKDYIYY
jgi:hypothetical protein